MHKRYDKERDRDDMHAKSKIKSSEGLANVKSAEILVLLSSTTISSPFPGSTFNGMISPRRGPFNGIPIATRRVAGGSGGSPPRGGGLGGRSPPENF